MDVWDGVARLPSYSRVVDSTAILQGLGMTYDLIEEFLGVTWAYRVHLDAKTHFTVVARGLLGNRICLTASDIEEAGMLGAARIVEWIKNESESFFVLIEKEIDKFVNESGVAWTEDLRVRQEPTPTQPVKQPGVVYLLVARSMRTDNGGRIYKIGRTNNLNARLDQLAVVPPFETELVHSILTNDSRGAEQFFHTRFAGKRLLGEWFELSDEDVQFINSKSVIEL